MHFPVPCLLEPTFFRGRAPLDPHLPRRGGQGLRLCAQVRLAGGAPPNGRGLHAEAGAGAGGGARPAPRAKAVPPVPPFNSGRTRGALGLRSYVAEAGRRPGRERVPSSSMRASVWAGLSGPGPYSGRPIRACPSGPWGLDSVAINCVLLQDDPLRRYRGIGASVPLAFAAAPSLGAPIPNVRSADSKCQFFGVLFTF